MKHYSEAHRKALIEVYTELLIDEGYDAEVARDLAEELADGEPLVIDGGKP